MRRVALRRVDQLASLYLSRSSTPPCALGAAVRLRRKSNFAMDIQTRAADVRSKRVSRAQGVSHERESENALFLSAAETRIAPDHRDYFARIIRLARSARDESIVLLSFLLLFLVLQIFQCFDIPFFLS